VAQLSEQKSVKKRARRNIAVTTTPGEEEAAALHWMNTGEETSLQGSKLEEAVTALRAHLQQDSEGVTRCGICSHCMDGRGCIRAANRRALREGNRGAQWAEEANGLVGRMFEVRVCYAAY
jgi:hypothetical protein